MKKRILGLLSATILATNFLATQVNADEVQLRADYPEQHVVVKGDTLWDISNTFLNTPWMWPEIWHVNPQIENPHLIYPGDVVRLIYLDGKPRIVIDRVVKLSPQMRVVDEREAIASIPLDRINKFLSRTRVVEPGALEIAPYVVSGEDKRLLTGEGDRVYARGDFDPSISAYGVYRKGQTYKDPKTGEVLGVEAIDIASSRMRALDENVATLAITRSKQETRIGDRLLQDEERTIESTFYPSAPDVKVDGEIIAVEGGVTQVGKLSVVVLNRGDREGIKVGNVMAIYKRGGQVRDRVRGDMVKLPDERAGLLMVFRTFEKLSLGLVLEADRALSTTDLIKNP